MFEDIDGTLLGRIHDKACVAVALSLAFTYGQAFYDWLVLSKPKQVAATAPSALIEDRTADGGTAEDLKMAKFAVANISASKRKVLDRGGQ